MSVPPGYRALRAACVRVVVRADLADTLGAWLLAPALVAPVDAEPMAGGRGAAWRLRLEDGLGVVLRANRRGGVLRHVVEGHYLGPRPRPFAELAVTVEARRRGVPAAEVLAARVEGGLVYRGALVTREVPGALPLLTALERAPSADARRALAASAGRSVARLHDAGVFHADLNLGNIVAAGSGAEVETTLLDFDRARLRRGPLGHASRRRNLERLRRSLRKLDPLGQRADPESVAAFHDAYGPLAGGACGC